MKKRISIADVAKLAGTSITTVSRVINDNGYPVSKEIRDRIQAAVQQLNYTPSLAAQGLRKDFNPVIGLIVRDIADTYFGEIAKGATEKAMEMGYLAFVCNTGRKPENELQFHELLWKNRVRGILLIGGGIDTPEYKAMLARQLDRSQRFGMRIVANAPQGIDIPVVAIDLVESSERITRMLVGKGHRTIGLITGDSLVTTSQEHHKGYAKVLAKEGITETTAMVQFRSFSERGGYDGCIEMLRQTPRPTAICCGCDPIGVGVLHALHDEGLRVPEDVSLISIGDTPIAAHLRPAMTSVHVPRYELGARAVEMILAESSSPLRSEYLHPEIIERDSVRDLTKAD